MTPDDLLTVQRSWTQLRLRRTRLVAALTCLFAAVDTPPIPPSTRAAWLYGAVDGLVGLLAAPSRLATQARSIGASWPDPLTAPSFAVDGRAWLAAAAECLPDWSDRTGAAWKEAWFLLSDVLATEALSPFAGHPRPSPDQLAAETSTTTTRRNGVNRSGPPDEAIPDTE
jgi:hypothetical protein